MVPEPDVYFGQLDQIYRQSIELVLWVGETETQVDPDLPRHQDCSISYVLKGGIKRGYFASVVDIG